MGARLGPEGAIFLALALWTFLPFAIFFLRLDGGVSLDTGNGVFNGSPGLQVADHLQYMAWVRDAGDHVLFGNRFDIKDDPRLFFHPLVAASGLVWKLGASIQLAALVWNPVTLIALFAGFAAYVRRLVVGNRAAQAAALVLALFFVTPAAPLVQWLGVGGPSLGFGTQVMALEMFPGGYLWGGFPPVFAVAAMPLFLLGVERILDPSRRSRRHSARWYGLWTGAAGLCASWFHPWQGLTLLVILAGLIAWDRFHRRNLALAVPVALTVAPLAYLFVLSHTDSAWAMAAAHHANYTHVGYWFVAGLAPALLAIPGFAGSDLDVQERLLRLWPAAALVVYFGLQQAWFYHALVGISLPLAILGVRGWRRLRLPHALAVVIILFLTLPGMVFAVQWLERTKPDHFFAYGESDALRYLEHSTRPGAVLAPLWLGQAVPAFAGRNTWLGHYTWTPDYGRRIALAEVLFSGRLGPARARRLVQETGVAFVASDCRHRTDLTGTLGPLVTRVRHFGCATVYDVRAPA